jgi:hypothetical protein
MTRLQDVQSTVADWLGLQPKSRWDRLMAIDWRDYVPSRQDLRGMLPTQRTTVDFDATSLVVGLVVGVGVGVGITLALSSRAVQPRLTRAREQVREAMGRVQEGAQNVPSRLNITRMEEQPTTR